MLSADSRRSGAIRWDRRRNPNAAWTAAKTASVTAMAGTVRRISMPAVTPSANANAA